MTSGPKRASIINEKESLPVRQSGGPTNLNKKWIGTTLSVVAALSVAQGALAQKKSGAETGLLGIKLYDSGLKVVSIYGTPDSVESVNGGGGAIGPGAAGGAPGRGGPGGPVGGPAGAPSRGPGGGGGALAPGDVDKSLSPFQFGNELLRQRGVPMPGGPSRGGGEAGGPVGPSGAAPGVGGPGGGAAGGGNSGRILYTRWVYNRNGSKYGFVLDKSNRVVQIEAIGLSNGKVKTARGVTFGSTFAQLIKKYSAPDGYEINGDNVVVRFLVKNKVAFKLSRLGANKPQVVTGIVVAAGKT